MNCVKQAAPSGPQSPSSVQETPRASKGGKSKRNKWGDDKEGGMTEAEAIAEQNRLLAEARARMSGGGGASPRGQGPGGAPAAPT